MSGWSAAAWISLAGLGISIASLALAAVSVWRAWVSSKAAERSAEASDARAAKPAVEVELLKDDNGLDVIEIRFDRDLDQVELMMETPEGDPAFRAFDGFDALSPGLSSTNAKRGGIASNVRAGHSYWIQPHVAGVGFEEGRVLLRCECKAGKRSWTLYADTGRFALSFFRA